MCLFQSPFILCCILAPESVCQFKLLVELFYYFTIFRSFVSLVKMVILTWDSVSFAGLIRRFKSVTLPMGLDSFAIVLIWGVCVCIIIMCMYLCLSR